jgi:aspartate dehydrogenase
MPQGIARPTEGPRIALIGYGAIGRELARQLPSKASAGRIVGVLARPDSRSREQAQQDGLSVAASLDELIGLRPDRVVECAGREAVAGYAVRLVEAGQPVIVASSGALIDDELRGRIARASMDHGGYVLVPAGAIGGLDALAAMARAGLETVTYRGRKPPDAWRGTAAETMCDLGAGLPLVFFEGSARQAAMLFPRNANVVASVGLAGVGLDDTRAQLVSDPAATANRHEIEAQGRAGTMRFTIVAAVFPDHPRTSIITTYSLLDAALNLTAPIRLG